MGLQSELKEAEYIKNLAYVSLLITSQSRGGKWIRAVSSRAVGYVQNVHSSLFVIANNWNIPNIHQYQNV